MNSEKLYTTTEIADMLSVSDRTVRNWIDEGKISAYKLGVSYRIKESDLMNFLNDSLVNKSNKEKET